MADERRVRMVVQPRGPPAAPGRDAAAEAASAGEAAAIEATAAESAPAAKSAAATAELRVVGRRTALLKIGEAGLRRRFGSRHRSRAERRRSDEAGEQCGHKELQHQRIHFLSPPSSTVSTSGDRETHETCIEEERSPSGRDNKLTEARDGVRDWKAAGNVALPCARCTVITPASSG